MHRRQRGWAVLIHTDGSPEMTQLSVPPTLTITLTISIPNVIRMANVKYMSGGIFEKNAKY